MSPKPKTQKTLVTGDDPIFYIPFSKEGIDQVTNVINALRGYIIGRLAHKNVSDDKEGELLNASGYALERIGDTLNNVQAQIGNESIVEDIKAEFNKELINAIMNTSDAQEIPTRIGEILEKYDILRRNQHNINKPELSNDIPF